MLTLLRTVRDARDDHDPEPEYILENLMITNGSTVLYGDSGAGKSTSLRRFILQAVRGGDFAGRKFKKRCRVLFLALEEPKTMVVKHFEELKFTDEEMDLVYLVAEGSPEHDDLLKTGFSNRAMAGELILNWLKNRIEEILPDIVIIDTLIDFMPLTDANAYAEMYVKVLSPIRHLARQANTHIIVTHHENRSGDYMGSMAFKAAPDNMIRLEGSDKDCRAISALRTNSGKVRYGVELPRTKLYLDGREAVMSEDEVHRAQYDKSQEGQWTAVILDYIVVKQNNHKTVHEIGSAIGLRVNSDGKVFSGSEEAALNSLLKHLVDTKKLSRNGAGKRGSPYRYAAFDATPPPPDIENIKRDLMKGDSDNA